MTDLRRRFGRWLGATLLGWLLGFVLIVALALAAEGVGIGGAQVMVGLGMGAGVGLVQGRFVRRELALEGRTWALASTLGLGAPFLLSDLLPLLGLDLPYLLPALVGGGALLLGAWQARLLRPRSDRAGWWVPASALAWTLAAATPTLADSLPLAGWSGLLAFVGLMLCGGVLLGSITGLALTRLLS